MCSILWKFKDKSRFCSICDWCNWCVLTTKVHCDAYVSTAGACRSRCHWRHRSEQLEMRAHIQVNNYSSRCCPIQSHCPAVPHYWWQVEPSRSQLGGKRGGRVRKASEAGKVVCLEQLQLMLFFSLHDCTVKSREKIRLLVLVVN